MYVCMYVYFTYIYMYVCMCVRVHACLQYRGAFGARACAGNEMSKVVARCRRLWNQRDGQMLPLDS
jgi:hypothetical protein